MNFLSHRTRKAHNQSLTPGLWLEFIKIESLREVKAKLSKIIKELPSEKSVVITKNGRPCAILFPVTEKRISKACCSPSEKIFDNCWTERTRRERRKASPDLKIFRTDAGSRLGKFLIVAKDLLPLIATANVAVTLADRR
jgi:prevent-host-death family protein